MNIYAQRENKEKPYLLSFYLFHVAGKEITAWIKVLTMPCCGTNGMKSLSFVVHSTERSPVVDGDTAVGAVLA